MKLKVIAPEGAVPEGREEAVVNAELRYVRGNTRVEHLRTSGGAFVTDLPVETRFQLPGNIVVRGTLTVDDGTRLHRVTRIP